jgi:putative transcriptional regulator
MDKIKIGIRLRSLRGELTQAQVAKALGISAPLVSMWESGQRMPGDDIKIKICKLYGVGVEELFYS